MKKDKKDKENTAKKAGASGKEVKPKRPRKKRKKLLKTPSHIIRLIMVWTYVILIFLLSMPFMTTTLYIKDDLSIGSDLSNATLTYADQAQLDKAADDLEKAFDSLKKNGEDVPESSGSEVAISSATFDWSYHISSGVNIERLFPLIERSKKLNRNEYTEGSVKAVNDATLKAQQLLCATVTISQSALQTVLGGAVNELPEGNISGVIISGIMMFLLVILPVAGFFITTFDKRSHFKNIYTAICCPVCIALIFFAVYPTIGIGAVISVILYILLFALTAGDIYAIQQERYIMRHPELEAEFTEKHPQFVKALINYKAVSLMDSIEEQEAEEKKAAQRKNKKSKK